MSRVPNQSGYLSSVGAHLLAWTTKANPPCKQASSICCADWQLEEAATEVRDYLAEAQLHPVVVLLDEAGQLSIKGLHMPEVHLQGGRLGELLSLHARKHC